MTNVPDEPHNEHQRLLANLGDLVVRWNHLEALVQMTLYGLAGGGSRVEILTAHFGNMTLSDALRTMAAEYGPDELKPHISHLLELFDRLRAYRNYYVHGIRVLAFDAAAEPVGLSQSMSAKARLVLHQETIRVAQLETCIQRRHTLAKSSLAFGRFIKPLAKSNLHHRLKSLRCLKGCRGRGYSC